MGLTPEALFKFLSNVIRTIGKDRKQSISAATTPDGLPFDAWMRVHVRLGARIVSICHKAFWVRNTVAAWEKWTGLSFQQSGPYIIQGALNPIEIDCDADTGVYCEPNVWMHHRI